MTDDWSLKNKRVFIEVDFKQRTNKNINADEYDKSGEYKKDGYYPKNDIEILRQKLIETFADYYNSYLRFQIAEVPTKEEYIYDVTKRINKLFGEKV